MKETLLDKFLCFINWWGIKNFFENWIYPAYYLKNLLFHRHDRIKLPQVKPWEYTDTVYFMLCANMEMIVNFIEKENPEKYICWYKDEEGNDAGHKYGECKGYTYLYPEYKDKWIMDIIKDIYHWWKVEYPTLLNDKDKLLKYWSDYLLGELTTEKSENGLYHVDFDNSNCPKTIEELEKKDVLWEVIYKYCDDKSKLLDEQYFHNIIKELEKKIFEEEQKYLHLCIEVRPYLWT